MTRSHFIVDNEFWTILKEVQPCFLWFMLKIPVKVANINKLFIYLAISLYTASSLWLCGKICNCHSPQRQSNDFPSDYKPRRLTTRCCSFLCNLDPAAGVWPQCLSAVLKQTTTWSHHITCLDSFGDHSLVTDNDIWPFCTMLFKL